MKSVFIYGAQGTGKTLLAPEMMKRFGLDQVVDEWWPGEPFPETGALVLTHMHPETIPAGFEAHAIESLRGNCGTEELVNVELEEMRARKNGAYRERNMVVRALASLFPSGIARTNIPGWSDDWHGCVYIDLPTGQVSWHYHDSHAHLFADLPQYLGCWDGHDTAEKYRRLEALWKQMEVRPAPRGLAITIIGTPGGHIIEEKPST